MSDLNQLETLSFKADNGGSIQFGRVIEFDVLNYTLGKKVTFTNDLNIKFHFFKSTDEVREASTGEVTVSNISEETYNLIKAPNTCQMLLRAGYVGQVGVVFFADVVSCKKVLDGNNTNIIFTVSANYFEYKLNYGVTISKNDGYTIRSVFQALMDNLNDRTPITGAKLENSFYFVVPKSFSDEDIDAYGKYTDGANFGDSFAFNGTLEKILGEVCNTHGFSATTTITGNKVTYLISIKDSHINYYLDKIHSNYPVFGVTTSTSSKIYDAKSENKAVVLSYKTGLLSTPHIDYKVFTVPENYKGLSTDKITLKSQIAINQKDAKEKERLEKYKAKPTAKPFKQRKMGTKRIKKTYLSVKAQLNPDIRPQSIIRIDSMEPDYNGLYRVRNVKYEADNQNGNFLVNLFLEDTNGTRDTETKEKVTEIDGNFGTDASVNGSLGSDTKGDISSTKDSSVGVSDLD